MQTSITDASTPEYAAMKHTIPAAVLSAATWAAMQSRRPSIRYAIVQRSKERLAVSTNKDAVVIVRKSNRTVLFPPSGIHQIVPLTLQGMPAQARSWVPWWWES